MQKKEPYGSPEPQVNISRSTAGRMWLVCCCVALAVIQSGLTDSGASLVVALAALLAALLTEFLCTCKTSGLRKIKDGSAAVTALVFALLLPNQIHPVFAALGAVFAIGLVKHSFGGLGSNWLNPALGGWLFTRFSWPVLFHRALDGSPLAPVPAGLPGTAGLDQLAGAASPLDSAVRAVLNSRIFSIAGAELPGGYVDLLVSRSPGIIADRGLLALLLGTVIITAFRAGRVWVPALYLGVFGILVRAFAALPYGGGLGQGDMLFHFFSGGTFAAAFLLMADPATGAKSRGGTAFMVILAAALTWFFRCQALWPYGACIAVAVVNALGPLVRNFEARHVYTRRRGVSA